MQAEKRTWPKKPAQPTTHPTTTDTNANTKKSLKIQNVY